MNREIAVVYGAGASHDSGYQMFVDRDHVQGASSSLSIAPPLDRNFFAQAEIKRATEKFPSIRFFVERYFSIPDGTNSEECHLGLEEVWSAVDLNYKHIALETYDWESISRAYLKLVRPEYLDWVDMDENPMAPGDKKPTRRKFLGDCGRDLKRLCYRIFGKPELHAGSADCYWRLHSLLSGMGYKIEHVTFNYDTCLERSLYTHEIPVHYVTDYGIADLAFVQKAVHIAKLHGSLNWTSSESLVEPLKVPSYPYMEGDFWGVEPEYPHRSSPEAAVKEPLIIPPTWFKNEINDDSRVENRVTQLILHQWRFALKALRRADLIIVIGYSFPITDFHVQRLFRLAYMDRANTNPPHILYCTKTNDGEEVGNGLSFLGDAAKNIVIETKGFSALCQEDSLKGHLNALNMPVEPQESGHNEHLVKSRADE